MTLTIQMPTFEVMKCFTTPMVFIPMKELIDARQTFILICREPGYQLPTEIVALIINCFDKIILTRVREKTFEQLTPLMNGWHHSKLDDGPNYIVLYDGSGQEIVNDINLMSCLRKSAVLTAGILGNCRAL